MTTLFMFNIILNEVYEKPKLFKVIKHWFKKDILNKIDHPRTMKMQIEEFIAVYSFFDGDQKYQSYKFEWHMKNFFIKAIYKVKSAAMN
jgi:hypothetical protein